MSSSSKSASYFISFTSSEYRSAAKPVTWAAPEINLGWSGEVTAKSTANGREPVHKSRMSLRVLAVFTVWVSKSRCFVGMRGSSVQVVQQSTIVGRYRVVNHGGEKDCSILCT